MDDLIYEALGKDMNVSDIFVRHDHPIHGNKKYFDVPKGVRLCQRFMYVLDGKTGFCFFNKDGEKVTVKAQKGDVIYLPTDFAYTSYWEDPAVIDHIYIEFNLFDGSEPVMLSDSIFVIASDEFGVIQPLFCAMNNEFSSIVLGSKIKCRSLFFEILHLLLINYLDTKCQSEKNSVLTGIIYIDNHYTEEISVNELAKMCNMCPSGFRQKFFNEKGMTPIEYRNYLRIKRAAELLRDGGYTVSEAAERVNIPDIFYFTKLFKRYFSVPPGRYRRGKR